MSKLYPLGKDAIGGAVNLLTDTIKVMLLDASYTQSDAHQYLTSASSAQVGSPVTLANKSLTGGVFDADNVVFTAVTGNAVTQAIVYRDTGVAGTSELLAFYNSATAGLPVTPNGGDITITWSNGASKMFVI